jgi:hypothetical protein
MGLLDNNRSRLSLRFLFDVSAKLDTVRHSRRRATQLRCQRHKAITERKSKGLRSRDQSAIDTAGIADLQHGGIFMRWRSLRI